MDLKRSRVWIFTFSIVVNIKHRIMYTHTAFQSLMHNIQSINMATKSVKIYKKQQTMLQGSERMVKTNFVERPFHGERNRCFQENSSEATLWTMNLKKIKCRFK